MKKDTFCICLEIKTRHLLPHKFHNFSFLLSDMYLVDRELQIKEGIEDNSKIIFLISQCCDPSLETTRQDSSNDGSQNMFLWRNMAIYP